MPRKTSLTEGVSNYLRVLRGWGRRPVRRAWCGKKSAVIKTGCGHGGAQKYRRKGMWGFQEERAGQ